MQSRAESTNNTKLAVAGTVRLETGERICWKGIDGRERLDKSLQGAWRVPSVGELCDCPTRVWNASSRWREYLCIGTCRQHLSRDVA